jgi:hypothetical protein
MDPLSKMGFQAVKQGREMVPEVPAGIVYDG